MSLSDNIAVGALLVSVFAILWTWLNDRKIKKLTLREKIETAESKKKGDIKIEFVRLSAAAGKLIFTNNGLCAATNISMKWDHANINWITVFADDSTFPYPRLNNGESFFLEISINSANREKVLNVVATWDDEFSQQSKKEISLLIL